MYYQHESGIPDARRPLLLIFPFELMSHYLRCLMLAKHFEPYFEILFADSEKYRDYVTGEGYGTFACKSLDAVQVMEGVKKFDFSWINVQALESVYLDQVRVITDLRPLVVIGDTSLTIKMAAEKTGVTFISLMNGYMSKYYSATRKISKTHPSYRFISLLPAVVLDLMTRKGEMFAFYTVHGPFKKIRFKHQLSKEIYYLDELEGDVNLICDLAELFPQKNLPSNYKVISPLFYDTDSPTTLLVKRLDARKRTIFVSMGSTGDWEKLRFLNLPYFEKYNLLAAGDHANVLTAAHIIKAPFINMHEVFPFTDLVICHGGNGTIYQALLYGIPLLCITNHFEQEWNADALERVNAGRSLNGKRTEKELTAIIDEWITKKASGINSSYASKITSEAEKLGEVVREIAAGITGVKTKAVAGARG